MSGFDSEGFDPLQVSTRSTHKSVLIGVVFGGMGEEFAWAEEHG